MDGWMMSNIVDVWSMITYGHIVHHSLPKNQKHNSLNIILNMQMYRQIIISRQFSSLGTDHLLYTKGVVGFKYFIFNWQNRGSLYEKKPLIWTINVWRAVCFVINYTFVQFTHISFCIPPPPTKTIDWYREKNFFSTFYVSQNKNTHNMTSREYYDTTIQKILL